MNSVEFHRLYEPLLQDVMLASFGGLLGGIDRRGRYGSFGYAAVGGHEVMYRIRAESARLEYPEQITLRNVLSAKADVMTELEAVFDTLAGEKAYAPPRTREEVVAALEPGMPEPGRMPWMLYAFGPRDANAPRLTSWYSLDLARLREWGRARVAVGKFPWHSVPKPQFCAIRLHDLPPGIVVHASDDVVVARREALF